MAEAEGLAAYLILPENAVEPYYIEEAVFCKEEKVLNVGQGFFYDGTETDTTLDIRSDKLKLILPASNSFYYMIHNVLGEILYYYNHFKKNIQIVYCMQSPEVAYNHPVNVFTSVHEYIFKVLDFHNIDYLVYDQSKNNGLFIDNYYIAKNLSYTSFSSLIYHYTEQMRQDKYGDKKEPFRKVYLSRKHFRERLLNKSDLYLKNIPYADHDNRIDDHEKLEDLLQELGFDVINPESFDSIEDQVQYFSEVKCIASLSSSGLANSIFMQPGQTVIEIMTPLIQCYKTHYEDQLHYYHAMTAFAKGHKYLSLNNLMRKVKLIEDQIKSDKNLYEYIKNV